MTQKMLVKTFGNPIEDTDVFEDAHMVKWLVPTDIKTAIPVLPEYIYCNKLLTKPLSDALRATIQQNLLEIQQWDGCYNPRMVRGENDRISMHAFGLAIDLNADANALGEEETTFSKAFIQCFKDNGWIWGGDFSRHDPMHFEFSPPQ